MSDAEALSQQLLRTQLQTPTRFDVFDEDVENLTVSHHQPSAEVRDAYEAQKDAATKVQTLRTHFHDSTVARLINTTELLEMVLLEVVDLTSDVAEGTGSETCDEHCDKYHYGPGCGKPDKNFYSRYVERVGRKIDEQARRLRTLLLSRRVSKCFQATIDGSSKLQQALFFTPNPPAGTTARINWLYLTSQVYHKLAARNDDRDGYLVPETSDATGQAYHVFFCRWACGVDSWPPNNHVLTLWRYFPHDCKCGRRGDCDIRTSSTSSSWMGMHFSQPPLAIQWSGSPDWKGPGGHWGRLPAQPTTISSLFSDV